MTSIASSRRSWRTSVSGQRSPRMCSLRFSPLPTPRKKRPGEQRRRGRGGLGDDRRVDPRGRAGDAGRRPRSARSPAATPPSTAQTNGLLPCWSTQGWKWSEIESEVEAGLLGAARELDQVARPELLAGERVADRRHGCGARLRRVAGDSAPNTSRATAIRSRSSSLSCRAARSIRLSRLSPVSAGCSPRTSLQRQPQALLAGDA